MDTSLVFKIIVSGLDNERSALLIHEVLVFSRSIDRSMDPSTHLSLSLSLSLCVCVCVCFNSTGSDVNNSRINLVNSPGNIQH